MKKKKKEFLIPTRRGSFRVNVWWDKSDRAYLVQGCNLPEVVTFGKTLTEAKRMAREALELYCECVIDDGKIIIDDSGRAIGKLPKSRVIALAG